jgi:hypothetical protein
VPPLLLREFPPRLGDFAHDLSHFSLRGKLAFDGLSTLDRKKDVGALKALGSPGRLFQSGLALSFHGKKEIQKGIRINFSV